MTESIPLNKLVVSPRNVRKTNADEDIAGLADSIASKGLLQNLVVSPSDRKGTYEVDAGGRRLRALQLLAERKELPKNWPVPVFVIGRENATEASLAENLQKVAMNPADEVEAFAAIVETYADNGMSSEAERVANCARRFGQTERYVKQRLALAALSPAVLDALRVGTITIAAAQAYASHPDPAEQLKVFKAHEKRTGTYGKHDPRTIRDELKGRLYTSDSHLVRYIGLEAYVAAGGQVVADLFFGEEDDRRELLPDAALVEKLAREKGELEAQQIAQKAGWLDATLAPFTGWQVPVPDGYRREYFGSDDVRKADRAEKVVLFELDRDGALKQTSSYFVKEAPAEEGAPVCQRAETPEEREAREREQDVRFRAAKLAAPKVAGTALEGRAFWPHDRWDWIRPIRTDDDGETVTLALLIKVPLADLEAQLEEARRRLEAEEKELAEEQEAIEAEHNGETIEQEAAPAAPAIA